jgi:hypothetical protein
MTYNMKVDVLPGEQILCRLAVVDIVVVVETIG